MQDFPHRYRVRASGKAEGELTVESEGLPALASAPPSEFGGPGDRWSPETLLVAAVADCFILTFRAVARASKLGWSALTCDVEGVLDRAEGRMRFTELRTRVALRVPPNTDAERARRLLEKADRSCLVTNSLLAESHLECSVEVEG